jgi:hypothetical protein
METIYLPIFQQMDGNSVFGSVGDIRLLAASAAVGLVVAM